MDKFSTVSHSWRRCSREYGAPGDILFSTVAGAPPHVHSPQKLEYFSDPGKSIQPVKYMPISLSNSLLDPNIELPAISVREVDAVLSSLNSSVSSTVAPDEVTCKPTTCTRKLSDNLVPKCSEAVDVCSVSSPIPFDDNYISNEKILLSIKAQTHAKKMDCLFQAENPHHSAGRRAFSLSIDKIPENCCGDERATSCLLGHVARNGNVPGEEFCQSDKDDPLSGLPANSSSSAQSAFNNRLKQECVQIFTLHSSDSMRVLSQSRGLKVEDIARSATTKDDCIPVRNTLSLQNPNVEKFGPVSRIQGLPLPKPQQLVRDRSPFVSLDLATQPMDQNSAYTSTTNEAVKCREANLSVRIANQAQFFPSRSVGSLIQPATVVQSMQPSLNTTTSSSSTELTTNGTSRSEQTPRLVHVQPSCGDDRFKYACPHPRCGRRYQAELALLRHLHKYHCEPIELPHRRRSQPNRRLQRRPASEERSRGENCTEPTAVNGTMKMLQSSISVEDTVSGTRTTTLLSNMDSRTSSYPATNSLLVTATSATVAVSASVVVVSAESNDPAPKTTPAPQLSTVLSCAATVASEQSPTVAGPRNSGLHRCIWLPPYGPKDSPLPAVRPTLVRSTSISHNFPQLFDAGESASPAATPEVTAHPARSSFRMPRLRSVSGSVSSLVDAVNPPHVFTDDSTSSRQWHSSELRSLANGTGSSSSTTTATPHATWPLGADTNVAPLGCSSDSHDGGGGDGGGACLTANTESIAAASAPIPADATCPSCGFDLDESDAKRREWMSGIRALTYSKTDSIACPMDGCAHVCSGRADLSAHLTASHFPEVQNQLVRLIFACPLKDCQTVCPDEVSFQAHFNRHLFGYLPGDLSGLFSSGLTTSSTPTATTPTETPSSSIADNCSPAACMEPAASTPVPLPAYSPAPQQQHISKRVEVYMDLASPDSNPSPLRSTSTDPDPRASPDVTADRTVYTVRVAAESSEPRALSDPSILLLHPARQSGNSQTDLFVTAADDAPGAVSDPTAILGSPNDPNLIKSRLEDNPVGRKACNESLDANRCPTSITFDGGHVDLTDHRNLLSALDLIPDDILMELLNEDRPGMWGEASSSIGGPSNFTTYSAPHEWDSPDWAAVPDDDPVVAESHQDTQPDCMDSSVAILPPTSSRSSDGFTLDTGATSTEDLLTPSSTNWVPSPVVHETWSLAVANERPYPTNELNGESRWDQHSPNLVFDCPSLVLSDLTAALILPEVERRLRAKHESSQHCRTNNTAPTAVSPALVAAVTSVSEAVNTGTQLDAVSVVSAAPGSDERHTRPSLGSGKRRRNASESSPTARYPCDNQCTTVLQPRLPSKSGKHGSVPSETDTVSPVFETDCIQMSNENKHAQDSMAHASNGFIDPPTTTGALSSSPRPVNHSTISTSTALASQWIGRATSYQRLCPSTTTAVPIDDDAVFVCPTAVTPSRGSQRDLIDLMTLHASPKHFGAQPKRRRRKVAKVYTTSSDLVAVVPSTKSGLQRRHSLVYCNLVPSANLPR